jgi:hypothetical protein
MDISVERPTHYDEMLNGTASPSSVAIIVTMNQTNR